MRTRSCLSVVVLLCGCAGGDGGGPPSAADCLRGWWTAPAQPCYSPEPEFSQPDCQQLTIKGFLDGGAYYTGTVSVSYQVRTMSASVPITLGTWRVVDANTVEVVTPAAGQRQVYISCSGDRLQFGSSVGMNRAAQEIAGVLNTQVTSGTTSFSAQPF